MSNNLLYWIYMGIAALLPFILGIWLMRRTDKLGYAFWVSTAVNVILTGAAVLWWHSVTEDHFKMIFGVVFYAIAAVNVAVVELFALVSIRKKSNS
jgi:hypothetical protein